MHRHQQLTSVGSVGGCFRVFSDGIRQQNSQLVPTYHHSILHQHPFQLYSMNNGGAANAATVSTLPGLLDGRQRIRLPLPVFPVDLGIDLASVRSEIDLCKRRYEREVWGVICAKALQNAGAAAPESGGSEGDRTSWKRPDNQQPPESAAGDEESETSGKSGNTAVGAGAAKRGPGHKSVVAVPASRPPRGQPASPAVTAAAGQGSDYELTEDPEAANQSEGHSEEGELTDDAGNANNRMKRNQTRSFRDNVAYNVRAKPQAIQYMRQLKPQPHLQQGQQVKRSVWRDDWNNLNNFDRRLQPQIRLEARADAASVPKVLFQPRKPSLAAAHSISTSSSSEDDDEETATPLSSMGRLGVSDWMFCRQQATNNGNSDRLVTTTIEEDKCSSGSTNTLCAESRPFAPLFCGNWTAASRAAASLRWTKQQQPQQLKKRQPVQEKPEYLPPKSQQLQSQQEQSSLPQPASQHPLRSIQPFSQLHELRQLQNLQKLQQQQQQQQLNQRRQLCSYQHQHQHQQRLPFPAMPSTEVTSLLAVPTFCIVRKYANSN